MYKTNMNQMSQTRNKTSGFLHFVDRLSPKLNESKLASQDIPTSNILLKETPASEPSEDPVDEDKNRASSSEPSVTFDVGIIYIVGMSHRSTCCNISQY
ncbi:hypothetical protein HID58_022836 [Brassica napus]|uniref:Uncharacterized protein n=1 Tax=Brassica napus TaxID=3708 RepID=A0ABQ8D0P6_BRANA|nr:hypothetical protein HID58_022836 [Brassica napus]